MTEQNYKNHSRMVPGYHYVAFTLILAVLVGSIIGIFKSGCTNDLHDSMLILLLTIATLLIAFFARSFALKAQDRAIRAEENFRYYIKTGKQLDTRLTMGQIIALRFAGDDEFVALAQRAVNENLSQKDIKLAIKNWKGDHYRV